MDNNQSTPSDEKYPDLPIEIKNSVEQFIISSGINIASNPGILPQNKLLALANNLCIAESTGLDIIMHSGKSYTKRSAAARDFLRYIDDLREQTGIDKPDRGNRLNRENSCTKITKYYSEKYKPGKNGPEPRR